MFAERIQQCHALTVVSVSVVYVSAKSLAILAGIASAMTHHVTTPQVDCVGVSWLASGRLLLRVFHVSDL